MAERVPPLNALRAFEAAGRYLSFTLAAAELGVTPGAISRQIRLLEDHLAVRLFHRGYREVTLTPGGRDYLAELTEAFRRIEDSTRRLRGAHRQRPLHIFSSMMFTMRWLMPRLHSYEGVASGNIRLSTSIASEPDPFGGGDVDAAIFLCAESPVGLRCHKLFASRLVPICSPALLTRTPLHRVEDLRNHTLLHSAVFPDSWAKWLAPSGPIAPTQQAVSFGSSSLAYQAAIEGLGVAMGQIALIRDDLAARRLVVPLPGVLQDGSGYIVAHPETVIGNELLAGFMRWLLAEAARETA